MPPIAPPTNPPTGPSKEPTEEPNLAPDYAAPSVAALFSAFNCCISASWFMPLLIYVFIPPTFILLVPASFINSY